MGRLHLSSVLIARIGVRKVIEKIKEICRKGIDFMITQLGRTCPKKPKIFYGKKWF